MLCLLTGLSSPAIAAPTSVQSDLSSVPLAIMQPSEIQATIQAAIAAWTQGRAEEFANLFAEDGEFIVPGHRWVGPEAIRQVTADFIQDHEATISIQHILIQDQHAAIEWQWQETNKSTGENSQANDVIMIDFVDGKIQRWREYIDAQSQLAG
ncbi:MAG: nuclear transport factor 2 family protein [Nodosilinea sp.]